MPSGCDFTLNPSLFFDAFEKYSGEETERLDIVRTGILCKDGTQFESNFTIISAFVRNIIYLKWGLGLCPKAGRRDASPTFSPFPGKGGMRDRDFKTVVYLINELFCNLTHSF